MSSATLSPFTTPPHILYIEDDATNTLLVQRIAEGFNFNLTVADNATEGMQKAIEAKPDIILMDVNLPDMDGLAATQMLLAHPEMKDARIIAVTASAMFGDRERCMEAGCVGYISKPFQIKTLLSEIKNHLPNNAADNAASTTEGAATPAAPSTAHVAEPAVEPAVESTVEPTTVPTSAPASTPISATQLLAAQA